MKIPSAPQARLLEQADFLHRHNARWPAGELADHAGATIDDIESLAVRGFLSFGGVLRSRTKIRSTATGRAFWTNRLKPLTNLLFANGRSTIGPSVEHVRDCAEDLLVLAEAGLIEVRAESGEVIDMGWALKSPAAERRELRLIVTDAGRRYKTALIASNA